MAARIESDDSDVMNHPKLCHYSELSNAKIAINHLIQNK